MATMKNLMGLRSVVLLAAAVTVMWALAIALGGREAFADAWPGDDVYDPYADSRPYVTEFSPQNGATGVSRMTNVRVTFSEEMDPTSINKDSFLLCAGSPYSIDCRPSQIPATVGKDPTDTSGRTYVLDPYGGDAGRLDPNQEYTVILSSVRDTQGIDLRNGSAIWKFTTAAASAPTVTQVSPPNGATGVPRNTNIKVTFSEEMDPATINGSTIKLYSYYRVCDWLRGFCYMVTSQVPTVTVSKDTTDPGGRTYVLDPTYSLNANWQYKVVLTTGVKDLSDGLNMPSEKVWYFTTGTS